MIEFLFALFLALSSPTHHPIPNTNGTVQVQDAGDDDGGDDGDDTGGDQGHIPPPPPPPPPHS